MFFSVMIGWISGDVGIIEFDGIFFAMTGWISGDVCSFVIGWIGNMN